MSDETIEFANGTISANKLETLLELREEEEVAGTGDAVIHGAYELADDGYDDGDCMLRGATGSTSKKLHNEKRVSVEELRERVNEASEESFEDYIESADWFYNVDEIDSCGDSTALVYFEDAVTDAQVGMLTSDENVSLGNIDFVDDDDRSGVFVRIYDERE